MTNRLALENSPYLVQHAENPVEWYPWGPEALERAHREDKPIFLSIGYAACHWCHVMAHESFEDNGIAALLNEHFVSIKVDREERPDLDNIYMSAVVAISGSGGWPMSVFLTPEGDPFFGGTYFPPERRYNIPAFREILETIARLWKNDRQKLLDSTGELRAHLVQTQSPALLSQDLDPTLLDTAALRLAQGYDWVNGGWGNAPKFPQPMAIEFLLARSARGDSMSRDVAEHAIQAMARGGMYDVVGGGFARYSTDSNWLVPHFEKMLYDNAQLARVYLHAFLITGKERYRRVCTQTLDFIARELMGPEGGCYSSLDADSEGEEGKYYAWTPDEIRTALQVDQGQRRSYREDPALDWLVFFQEAYHLPERGNFEGRIVLQRKSGDDELAQHFSIDIPDVHAALDEIHAALYAFRSKRIRPGTDDKVLTGWNALALIAFSEAARYLERADYLQIARQNAAFLLDNLIRDDVLFRSWRAGSARHPGYLEDHAGLILGLLALYQSDPQVRWFSTARQLTEMMLTHFHDSRGGFFDTRDDQETLILRPKDMQDTATPSGNALAVLALLQMAVYTGNSTWRVVAKETIGALQSLMSKHPTAFAQWLSAADFAAQATKEIALLSDSASAEYQTLQRVIWRQYRPDLLVAAVELPLPEGSPELLHERELLDGRPTAYLCYNFTCQRPTNDAEILSKQLEQDS